MHMQAFRGWGWGPGAGSRKAWETEQAAADRVRCSRMHDAVLTGMHMQVCVSWCMAAQKAHQRACSACAAFQQGSHQWDHTIKPVSRSGQHGVNLGTHLPRPVIDASPRGE